MFENTFIKTIIKYFRLNFFKRNWRKINYDNGTLAINYFPINLVKIGKNTYGELNIVTFNSNSKLKIGSYCSIAQNVTFLLDVEHNINHISTYPFLAKCFEKGDEAFSKGNIIVDDDVWIGYGSIIMSGVHIGQGAVIAAGAVVTKDVPPYAIVGGVPAKVIKYRFNEKMIAELMKIDYGKLTNELIQKHVSDLYSELNNKEQLEWIPKKIEGNNN